MINRRTAVKYVALAYNLRIRAATTYPLVMGLSPPGLAWDRPGPVHFFRALARLFEKDLENWSFYGVKVEAHQGLGLNFFWRAWVLARLELKLQGSGLAGGWSFRALPITSTHPCIMSWLRALLWRWMIKHIFNIIS